MLSPSYREHTIGVTPTSGFHATLSLGFPFQFYVHFASSLAISCNIRPVLGTANSLFIMSPITPRRDEASGVLPTLQQEPHPKPIELVTDQLEIPSLDDWQYRVIWLPNRLEVLLVHDPETDKASAALDVNVGNFSDEDTMPGMAHAVEHFQRLHRCHLNQLSLRYLGQAKQ